MEPGLSLIERPHLQLMREFLELRSCQQIRKLRRRCWQSSCEFIASHPGESDAISLARQARLELSSDCGRAAARARSSPKAIAFRPEPGASLGTDIDVRAGPATLSLDGCEVGPFVPVGFGVVVIREGIESGRLSLSPSDDPIGHADDR